MSEDIKEARGLSMMISEGKSFYAAGAASAKALGQERGHASHEQ